MTMPASVKQRSAMKKQPPPFLASHGDRQVDPLADSVVCCHFWTDGWHTRLESRENLSITGNETLSSANNEISPSRSPPKPSPLPPRAALAPNPLSLMVHSILIIPGVVDGPWVAPRRRKRSISSLPSDTVQAGFLKPPPGPQSVSQRSVSRGIGRPCCVSAGFQPSGNPIDEARRYLEISATFLRTKNIKIHHGKSPRRPLERSPLIYRIKVTLKSVWPMSWLSIFQWRLAPRRCLTTPLESGAQELHPGKF